VKELVDSVTTGSFPSVSTTGDHLLRALVDLNEGEVQSGLDRIEQVSAVSRMATSTEDVRLTAQGAATILLWARQPGSGQRHDGPQASPRHKPTEPVWRTAHPGCSSNG
jgi:hypothetical protein